MGRGSKVAVSAKCVEVLRFIESFVADKGYSPSVREVAAGTGLRSPASAHRYLKRLIASGDINVEHRLNRTIRIISK